MSICENLITIYKNVKNQDVNDPNDHTFDFASYSKNSKKLNNFKEAILALEENSYKDMVFFHDKYHLVPNNISFINKDIDGRYYTEIDISKQCDIYTNFTLEKSNHNIMVELILNDLKMNINSNTILLSLCSLFTQIKLRFTFFENLCDIKFSFDAYLCQSKLRKQLGQNPPKTPVTDIRYYQGIAIPEIISIDNCQNKKIHEYLFKIT
jgi:hypothetical protein